MTEHLIRLRRGWLCLEEGGLPNASDPESGRELTLPVTWPERAGSMTVVRLVRLFTAPSIDPACESLSLRLSAVAGLVSVQLNGRELARPTPGNTALELPLDDPLPRRNRLVLDVLPPGAGAAHGFAEPAWGFIALVIKRGASPAEDSSAGSVDESLGGSGPPE
jgi:hypothetical protein